MLSNHGPLRAFRLITYHRVRSYRSQFHKWEITRTSQLKELREHTGTATGRHQASVVDDNAEDVLYGTSGFERSHSIPPDMRPFDMPIDNQHRDAQAIHRSVSDAMPVRTLVSLYRALQQATEGECHRMLSETDFYDGNDNILHCAAAGDDTWTLNCILDYIKSSPAVIDFESTGRHTALELAILAGKVAMVETMLRAGASVQRPNRERQQPLHFAILHFASATICSLLIDFGAKLDAPLVCGNVRITPINLVLQRFLNSKNDRERDVLCSILQLLVDHGAQISSDEAKGEPSLIRFVKASTELDSTSLSVRQNQIRPSSLLGYYLNADRDPLCWFPKQYCPAHECKSFAAFIFAHTPKSGLSEILLESSNMMRYGLDLVRVLLSPCRMRYSNSDDPSINDLLRKLLARMKADNVTGTMRPGILALLVSQMPKKKSLKRLETLLRSGYVSAHECTEVIPLLIELEEHVRLPLFELLISQTDLPPSRPRDKPWEFQDIARCFFPNPRSSKFQDLAGDPHTQESFKHRVLSELQICQPSFEVGECIVQCVIHVFTKRMLEGEMGRNDASAERIIYIASRLRKTYRLPDIPVAKDLLLELHYVSSQPNKHISAVQRSDASDSSDSPETVMSEGPSCPTPANTVDMDCSRSS